MCSLVWMGPKPTNEICIDKMVPKTYTYAGNSCIQRQVEVCNRHPYSRVGHINVVVEAASSNEYEDMERNEVDEEDISTPR